jgi:ABC-type bacteriocin/lantibiotic exporter with double-glycine peptidase domain
MLRRLAAPALLVCVAVPLALAGCRSTKVGSPLLSDQAVMLDLPLVRQDELYNCGLAAISALCQYWDVDLPADQRATLARLASDEKGLSGNELRAALESRGFDTFLFRGALDRSDTGVYKQIDAGRPLVVMVSPDGKAHHYCLVLGYDEPRENVVLLDPARGQVLRTTRQFDKDWAVCERFTLLACPKDTATAAAEKKEGPDLATRPAGSYGGEGTAPKEKRP